MQSAKGNVFNLPSLTLLDKYERKITIVSSRMVEQKLADLGIKAKVVNITRGLEITLFEMEALSGVNINKIDSLADDFALALQVPFVRTPLQSNIWHIIPYSHNNAGAQIVPPTRGKGTFSIEIPNKECSVIHIKDILRSKTYCNFKGQLPIVFGVDPSNKPLVVNLVKIPHVLMAGMIGSATRTVLNSMICSLLFKVTLEDVKIIMIDSNNLDMSAYEGIPHLIHPVVTDSEKALKILTWVVGEVHRRHMIFKNLGVKCFENYNKLIEKNKAVSCDPDTSQNEAPFIASAGNAGRASARNDIARKSKKLPYVVLIINDLADLMMLSPRKVEESLAFIASEAGMAGIHVIMLTRVLSVDVITGVIKACYPNRIALRVPSMETSRLILDNSGVASLLNSGDIILRTRTDKVSHLRGAYVSGKDIHRVVSFLKKQCGPANYNSICF